MFKEKISDQEIARINKFKKMIKNNKNPFSINEFERTHTSFSFNKYFNDFDNEKLKDNNKNIPEIKIAGRIKNFRNSGKSVFSILQDQYGIFQIYIRKDNVESSIFENFVEYLDIGDIIGVIGKPMKTKTNELTLRINNFVLLSKCFKPLPNKFSGIKDIEEKYRKRYIDFIMSPQLKDIFIKRSKIISLIRFFFDNKKYLEVETPVLQLIHGGAAAKPFITYHNSLGLNFYLRVATEIPLKKLIISGFEGVYEIGRIFRNEGMDTKHNPEFTSVEVYVAYKNMEFMMDLTEELFCFIINKILNRNYIFIENKKIIFDKPWKRINMLDSIKENTGIDFNNNFSFDEMLALAKKNDIIVESFHNSKGHIINLFFEKFVEKNIIQPTFIYNYPIEVSPLAKENIYNNNFTDRFELFINGLEYANAYSELNDPFEQLKRFENQIAEKESGNEEANEIDHEFIEALKYGMPPTGGLGIGIDRLVMLLTSQNSIKDVIFFPHMKPKK